MPRKRKQIGFLLAPIVKEVSNIVSNLLMSFLLQRLTTSKSSIFFLFSAFFYHYKGPRQTKLSGVIPCQKFFGEPVLITTGRFYHRSKKDVMRLSMTTVTDVDCFNIITIRLSIVFGDCVQSAEVKSKCFMRFLAQPSR